MKVVGDFTFHYILNHQDLILDDNNKKDWYEISKLVLYSSFLIFITFIIYNLEKFFDPILETNYIVS